LLDSLLQEICLLVSRATEQMPDSLQ